jgi:hypothetical protein
MVPGAKVKIKTIYLELCLTAINYKTMKKLLFLLVFAVTVSVGAHAQQKEVKNETKVKKTTTIPQKVHNVFSKHKHYSGTKVKHVKKVEKNATTSN